VVGARSRLCQEKWRHGLGLLSVIVTSMSIVISRHGLHIDMYKGVLVTILCNG